MSRKQTADELFRISFTPGTWTGRIFHPLQRGSRFLPALRKCRRLYAEIGECTPQEFCGKVLETMEIKIDVEKEDLARIPRRGPLIVVANHPYGGVDGIILLHLLKQVRTDVRVMANMVLSRIPELQPDLIGVDPFGGPGARIKNLAGMRHCLNFIREGGCVVVFPAGEVSHLLLSRRRVSDPQWTPNLARLIRCSNASVLPVFFPGRNSLFFQVMGMIHPRMRTALLPHELINKKQTTITVRIGTALPFRRLQHLAPSTLLHYVRARTYLLEQRSCASSKKNQPRRAGKALEPVGTAIHGDLLREEISALPPQQRLVENGPYEVFYAEAFQIPKVLSEIGRLRERTFREVGEGTGRSLDLDRFDCFYSHLFVWNGQENEIIGAYRLGRSDRLLEEFGRRGFYTHTLFHYRRPFIEQMGPALEMGRSFVRSEYQKGFHPLMLLWKGIGHFIARHPRYAVLFGPVSISHDYSSASRDLMARTLMTHYSIPELGRLVKGRNPLHFRKFNRKEKIIDVNGELFTEFDDLAAMVSELENNGKTVPVLLRQYLNLGGRILALNVDKDFSDVLDALVLVDLRDTELKTLERYCGREGAQSFREFHQRHDLVAGF
jgi:putative hemolysin